jgi:hypothetical protein
VNDVEPSPTESNGRDQAGKFTAGNKLAKGNPFARRVQKIRAALFKAVKPADVRQAVEALMKDAKAGDRMALAEILDRTIGRSIPADVQQQIDELREQIEAIVKEQTNE